MKGILKNQFHFLDIDWDELRDEKVEKFSKEDVVTFNFDEEVEILKVIHDKSYLSRIAYVILNRNNDSMTLDSFMVDLIDE
jgi:hypothetical protein